MRILITGGRGQLGIALQKQLTPAHELTLVDLPDIDITERDSFFDLMRRLKPEFVINCAAYTNVDGCAKEPAAAYKANGYGAQNVALACRQVGAPMMHISTNEVFAGEQYDGYDEWMPLQPINPYGNSKAAGEFFVRAHCPRHYIVRTAWLYAPGGRNFIHAILNRARSDGAVRVVTDEVGNPTYAADLAGAIEQLMDSGQFGAYHLANAGSCSRWAFANEILRLAKLPDVINTPILSSEFKRASVPPKYAALNNNAARALGIEMRPWQDALADYMAQFA